MGSITFGLAQVRSIQALHALKRFFEECPKRNSSARSHT
jgi:hypothetical protein